MDRHIDELSSAEPLDRRIARLANSRHGVFTRSQALQFGATPGVIEGRLKSARWEVLYPGVYRLSGTSGSWRQRLYAARLASGAGAVASHRAGGALWTLPGAPEGIIEISVPMGRRVRRPGIIVHVVRGLAPIDVTEVDAIAVTTATRTLIDLATVFTADALEEALDDALRRRLTSIPHLRRRIGALGSRGRPGIGMLLRFIEVRAGATPESVLETRFLRLLRRAGLPMPQQQFEVRERGRLVARVDFAYPDVLLAIEVDGYRWHSGRARWEHDLGRRNALTGLGWRVLHVTSSDLAHHPDRIVRMITQMLGGEKG